MMVVHRDMYFGGGVAESRNSLVDSSIQHPNQQPRHFKLWKTYMTLVVVASSASAQTKISDSQWAFDVGQPE
jgi:hypothetical protein